MAGSVTGAYSVAIEQRAAGLFHPASAYVVLDQSSQQVGKGSRGILAFDAAKDSPLQVKYGDAGTLQAFTGPAFNYLSGSIQGLMPTMENGGRVTLVEIGRYLRGARTSRRSLIRTAFACCWTGLRRRKKPAMSPGRATSKGAQR